MIQPRYSLRPLLVCALLLAGASTAFAQVERPARIVFLRPYAGIASYVGDNSKSFFNFDGDFPYAFGLQLGYQFTPSLSLSGGYLAGRYPGIEPNGDSQVRHTAQLFLRYDFGRYVGVTPYLQGGAHATFGEVRLPGSADAERRTAFGPMAGLGVDIPLGGQVSIFFEATTHGAFPDDAADGSEDGGSGGFDLLSTFGTGLKINFGRPPVAPEVASIDGPTRLETGQNGTYTAVTNDAEATQPVEYRWAWGDGATSTGLTASHTYNQAGTYTIRFTASNRAGADEASMTVTVANPPVPAEIISLTADPTSPDTRTPVQFSASVRGDAPISYAWDFGDGESSTAASPTHTFDQEGTYTVTLEASNAAGSDSRTLSLTVRPYEAEICAEIEEMNSVYFGRNSSVLSDEARVVLSDNLEILRECPNMNVRVEGWAAPGERNPESLSQDRARVVSEYYQAGGVAASRINPIGMGVVPGQTSKKEGAAMLQRADTIPLR